MPVTPRAHPSAGLATHQQRVQALADVASMNTSAAWMQLLISNVNTRLKSDRRVEREEAGKKREAEIEVMINLEIEVESTKDMFGPLNALLPHQFP